MLCLSGFELYSRWVPLRAFHNVGEVMTNDLSPRVAKERIGGKLSKIPFPDQRFYLVGDLMDIIIRVDR